MNLRQEVYNKIAKDYFDYINDLKYHDVDYILDKSYETAIKNEMTFYFDPAAEYFSLEKLKELNKEKHPLESVYSDWISNDFSIGNELKESINEYLYTLQELNKKQKNIEKCNDR